MYEVPPEADFLKVEGEDYLMDHSTFSYLMNTNGLVEFFRRDISAEDMAKTISCYIEEA